MSKRSKRNRASRSQVPQTTETRTAETATVAWVTLTLTTLLCEIGAAVVTLIGWAAGSPLGIALLGRLLFFAACVAALIGLAFLPLVNRLRDEPLPRLIVTIALGIYGLPLIAALWFALSAL